MKALASRQGTSQEQPSANYRRGERAHMCVESAGAL
jgi:hypothetical protein